LLNVFARPNTVPHQSPRFRMWGWWVLAHALAGLVSVTLCLGICGGLGITFLPLLAALTVSLGQGFVFQRYGNGHNINQWAFATLCGVAAGGIAGLLPTATAVKIWGVSNGEAVLSLTLMAVCTGAVAAYIQWAAVLNERILPHYRQVSALLIWIGTGATAWLLSAGVLLVYPYFDAGPLSNGLFAEVDKLDDDFALSLGRLLSIGIAWNLAVIVNGGITGAVLGKLLQFSPQSDPG
jgi:hypothetical protein